MSAPASTSSTSTPPPTTPAATSNRQSSSSTTHRSTHGPAPGSLASKRLSCISCRSRKVRCDRLLPCAPCTRSGITCCYPKPAPPRQRTGAKAKSAEIQGRLSRLESLVGAMGGEEAVAVKAKAMLARKEGRGVSEAVEGEGLRASEVGTDRGRGNDGVEQIAGMGVSNAEEAPAMWQQDVVVGVEPVLKEGGGRFMSGDFWSNLSTEVEGLRELLNEKGEDESEDEDDVDFGGVSSPSTGIADTASGSSPGGIHFAFQSTESGLVDLTECYPYPPLVTWLFETYFSRFDPTFKVLHKPTTYTIFNAISTDPARPTIRGGQEALIFAIFYAAITCSKPDECLKQFHEERSVLAKRYERATQAALTNADCMNSNELVTLQAFVIYLACYRSHHETRTMWTLLAIVVRIAYALDLQCDGELLSLPPFEVEMRRRCFWQIIVLDAQASEDRASIPMVMEHTFDTKMPSNINDEDLDPKLGLIRGEHQGCTEITFSLICHESSRALQILSTAHPRRKTFVPIYTPSQTDRENRVYDVSQRLHSRFIVHCDTRVPMDWFCSMVSQIVILKFFLLSHYPSFSRMKTHDKADNDTFQQDSNRPSRESLLSTSISLLELQHRLEHSSLAWSWIARNFVQWHPLAVTLATLCVVKPGSSPLIERAWAIVDTVFDEWSNRVADRKKGQLWQPIKKLLDRARKVHSRPSPSRNTSASPRSVGGTGSEAEAQQYLNLNAKAPQQSSYLDVSDMSRNDPVPPYVSAPIDAAPTQTSTTMNLLSQGMDLDPQTSLYDQSIAMALDNNFVQDDIMNMQNWAELGPFLEGTEMPTL